MKKTFQVRVGRRGVITLPKALRVSNHIEEGDFLTLSDRGDGVVVMSVPRSQVQEIANKLAAEWRDSGETLSTMLQTHREDRAKYDPKKR